MFRDLFSAFLVLAAAIVVGSDDRQPPQALNESPGNQSPVNQSASVPSAGNQSAGQPQDPAAIVFSTEAGMVLHAVKPASVSDYEAAMTTLTEALGKSEDPETRKLAHGWRIFKASEPDAKSSIIYVHFLDPAVAGVDYRPSLWLDKLLSGAPPELLAKYRDAFASPPTKLSLSDVTKLRELQKPQR